MSHILSNDEESTFLYAVLTGVHMLQYSRRASGQFQKTQIARNFQRRVLPTQRFIVRDRKVEKGGKYPKKKLGTEYQQKLRKLTFRIALIRILASLYDNALGTAS
jgi:hypothetical protein